MWIVLVLSIIGGVIALDQISKQLVLHLLYGGQVEILPGVLNFTYVENRGMAFGLLADQRWIFLVLSVVGIALVAFYLARYVNTTLPRVGLSLIIGGGIGNMIDRTLLGFVVDFIDFCAFDFWVWVFNIADAAVCVGAGLFMLDLILELVREVKAKKPMDGAENKASEGENGRDS